MSRILCACCLALAVACSGETAVPDEVTTEMPGAPGADMGHSGFTRIQFIPGAVAATQPLMCSQEFISGEKRPGGVELGFYDVGPGEYVADQNRCASDAGTETLCPRGMSARQFTSSGSIPGTGRVTFSETRHGGAQAFKAHAELVFDDGATRREMRFDFVAHVCGME